MKHHADVIIVGAGIVGLSTALYLVQNSTLNVTVIERGDCHLATAHESKAPERVYALNQHSEQFLQSLGVGSQGEAALPAPFRAMCVSDATGSGEIRFQATELARSHLGIIQQHTPLHQALLRVSEQLPRLTVLANTTLTELSETETALRCLQDDKGNRYEAPLLIAADGGRSWLRQQAGMPFSTKQYQHHALVATVHTEKSHQQTAWQVFLQEGPLAFLPLDNTQQCSIVWSAVEPRLDALMLMSDDDFNRAITQAFPRLGDVRVLSSRARFPLVRGYAPNSIKAGIALVGDAAHTIHPLAGQGLNLGLKDAEVLAKHLVSRHKRGRSFASVNSLSVYQRKRKGNVLTMLAAMDGFQSLFMSTHPTVKYVRNTGLNWMNQAGPLKRFLMAQA